MVLGGEAGLGSSCPLARFLEGEEAGEADEALAALPLNVDGLVLPELLALGLVALVEACVDRVKGCC